MYAIALFVFTRHGASGQILWKAPPRLSVSDWINGPGGADAVPHPPFKFVKENMDGTNPKVDVTDSTGRSWTVKFGSEVSPDVFAARMSYALGYAASPSFYVAEGVIEGVHGLRRAKWFLSREGNFHAARFKLHERHKRSWSWAENPFHGTHELGGLKILVMLLSDWDTKDARDGEGSNNTIFEPAHAEASTAWYAVTDWGASLGKSGGYFERDRWDWRGYREQTPHFVALGTDGKLQWGFHGKHGEDITAGVSRDDIRWLLPYLSRITDQELTAGLVASGGLPLVARQFTQSIRERIQELQRVANAEQSQEVAAK
jgi:hypothetical protein